MNKVPTQLIMKPLALIFLIFFYGCTGGVNVSDNADTLDVKEIYIYIPLNYTGWVNIMFRDTSKNAAEPLTFNNGYVYLINKDPQFFKSKADDFPSGKYNMHYYYYNTDTIVKLSWLGYPKSNILFERTIGSPDVNKYRSSLYTFSFYVSKEPLNVDGLSVDMLPKNKILE